MDSLSFIYLVFFVGVTVMVAMIIATYRSNFEKSLKITMYILSVMPPWLALILFFVFRHQYKKRIRSHG